MGGGGGGLSGVLVLELRNASAELFDNLFKILGWHR